MTAHTHTHTHTHTHPSSWYWEGDALINRDSPYKCKFLLPEGNFDLVFSFSPVCCFLNTISLKWSLCIFCDKFFCPSMSSESRSYLRVTCITKMVTLKKISMFNRTEEVLKTNFRDPYKAVVLRLSKCASESQVKVLIWWMEWGRESISNRFPGGSYCWSGYHVLKVLAGNLLLPPNWICLLVGI